MALAHSRELDWHDPSCRRLDYAPTGGHWATCLSCGSVGLIPYSPPPLPSESSFRLLRLLPGSVDEVVQCEIHVDDLRDLPRFFAISYTWADDDGDDRKLANISINSRALRVTKNCDAALRRVRKWSANVYVWIDAICIDQDNDMERGHQVKLMPQIYIQARKVFMYVGEYDDDSRNACMNLEIPEREPELMKVKWEALWHAIKARRYFTRLWILQEIALARRAILLCGNSFYDWKDITDCFSGTTEMGQHQHHAVLRFDHLLFTKPNLELFVLDCGKPASAKDPRDKVYGLLGLLPARRIGTVVADYTISTQQLYTEVAIQLAQLHGWAAVLERAGSKNRSLSSLPSWVPDWSSTSHGRHEYLTTSSPEVKNDHSPLVSENKVRLKVCRTAREDRWVLSNRQDGNVDTYMLFPCNDPIVDPLFGKGRENPQHQPLHLKVEQLDTPECSSSVLCEATLDNDMIFMPIEQYMLELRGQSDWSSYRHGPYKPTSYFPDNKDSKNVLRADAQDERHQEADLQDKISLLVFQISSWSFDICPCRVNIGSLEDNGRLVRDNVYLLRRTVRSLSDNVHLLEDTVRSLSDNLHWLECIFGFLQRRVYRRHKWIDTASLWDDCRDKLSSLDDAFRSWRKQLRQFFLPCHDHPLVRNKARVSRADFYGACCCYRRRGGNSSLAYGGRPWRNDTRFSDDELEDLDDCYHKLYSLECDSYRLSDDTLSSRDVTRSSNDYRDKLSSLENDVSSWRDVVCSLRDDICSWYIYQDRLHLLADPKDISWRDLAKHLKHEPAEAWICHAKNLWAEKYFFKGSNDPRDSKEHASHVEAAIKANSNPSVSIQAEGRKDKEQEEREVQEKQGKQEKQQVVKEGKLASDAFEMSDLLWRLLVQRFAVRSQFVDIV